MKHDKNTIKSIKQQFKDILCAEVVKLAEDDWAEWGAEISTGVERLIERPWREFRDEFPEFATDEVYFAHYGYRNGARKLAMLKGKFQRAYDIPLERQFEAAKDSVIIRHDREREMIAGIDKLMKSIGK